MDRWIVTWLVFAVFTALACEIVCLVLPSWFTYHYWLVNALVWVCLTNFVFEMTKTKVFTSRIDETRKAVFISGCDSGFGYHAAQQLYLRGFHVFAGCLFPTGDGATQLSKECSDRLQLVHIDVTKDESVEKARDFVKDNLGTCELWAIVNNAGVYRGFDVEFSKTSDFEDCLNVNVLGQIRVTKAFTWMLKKSKGRIVNVNSVVGRVYPPHISAYVMSKHASVAFTECLRQEMEAWDIRVISVEPEFFKTPMTDHRNLRTYINGIFDSLDETSRLEYGTDYLEGVANMVVQTFRVFASKNIELVTDAIESAICLRHPCSVYKPRVNQIRRCFFYIAELTPTIWGDVFTKCCSALYRVPKPVAARRYSHG